MTRRTKPENVQKSVSKKAFNNSMMEEAPLFAGLDNFVLPQAVKKLAETTPAEKPVKKKKTVKRQTPQVPSVARKPKSVPKEHKTQPLDPHAVLLSVTEICTLLKISRATLIRMDKAGKLPGRIKLGGSVRFHRETINTWLESLITTHPTP